MQNEIRLSGTGGQGLILAGILLSEAAGIHDGRHVVQTQSYGPEARGGASKSDVIISDQEILHTQVIYPDYLVCLSQQAYDRYSITTRPGATVIYDSLFVKPEELAGVKQIPVAATETAVALGTRIVANVVALGALYSVSVLCRESESRASGALVSWDALEKALLARAPKGSEEINRKALEAGKQLALSAAAGASL